MGHPSESGLDNFGARFDSSTLGRFMSPDALMASATVRDPRTWNRYTYALDNPLRFVDPDGMKEVSAEDCQKDANCVSVKINVIYDRAANDGKGLTDAQKKAFDPLLQKAKDDYGDADIHFEVSYTAGGNNDKGSIDGLSKDSVNVIVSDFVPQTRDSSGSQVINGYALTQININEAGKGDLEHELAHHFTGDTTGAVDWISRHDNITLGLFNRLANAAFDGMNAITTAQLDPSHGGPARPSKWPCTRCNLFNAGAREFQQAVLTQKAIRPQQ